MAIAYKVHHDHRVSTRQPQGDQHLASTKSVRLPSHGGILNLVGKDSFLAKSH
jgi:hypothetical protein